MGLGGKCKKAESAERKLPKTKVRTHHGCGEFSGVNGTPLLRGIEFTHAPSQAGERMAGRKWKGKAKRVAGCAGRMHSLMADQPCFSVRVMLMMHVNE